MLKINELLSKIDTKRVIGKFERIQRQKLRKMHFIFHLHTHLQIEHNFCSLIFILFQFFSTRFFSHCLSIFFFFYIALWVGQRRNKTTQQLDGNSSNVNSLCKASSSMRQQLKLNSLLLCRACKRYPDSKCSYIHTQTLFPLWTI